MFTVLSLPPVRSIKKTVKAKRPFEGYTLTCICRVSLYFIQILTLFGQKSQIVKKIIINLIIMNLIVLETTSILIDLFGLKQCNPIFLQE